LCPIIYLDYFWCIKYQYMHKYMKIGKRNGKRKKKRGFLLTGPRGFLAQPAHQRGQRRDGAVGAGPRVSEEGRGRRYGGTGRSSTAGEAPRLFSVAVPVLCRRSGGKARAEVGDYGGGANLAGGCLGRPVHGEVAGARGGGIAGEVVGRNR
jgi:hypothetical protein